MWARYCFQFTLDSLRKWKGSGWWKVYMWCLDAIHLFGGWRRHLNWSGRIWWFSGRRKLGGGCDKLAVTILTTLILCESVLLRCFRGQMIIQLSTTQSLFLSIFCPATSLNSWGCHSKDMIVPWRWDQGGALSHYHEGCHHLTRSLPLHSASSLKASPPHPTQSLPSVPLGLQPPPPPLSITAPTQHLENHKNLTQSTIHPSWNKNGLYLKNIVFSNVSYMVLLFLKLILMKCYLGSKERTIWFFFALAHFQKNK